MLRIERLEREIIYYFWSNKTKDPKQDRPNQIRLRKPEGGEP
jgi:hypothetical protein